MSGQGVNASPPVHHTAPPLYPAPPSTINAAAESIMELSSNSVLYTTPTFVPIQNADRRQIQDSIGHWSMSSLNSSGASTPVFPNGMDTDGMFDENGGDDVDPTPIPDWFELDIGEIYEHLNPRTKQGQSHQRGWQK